MILSFIASLALSLGQFSDGRMGVEDKTDTLREASVSAVQPLSPAIRTLGGERLRTMAALPMSDALRFFSGAQIKDYGGLGGLKTINVREMGSHHSMVFYDGIAVTNAQNGIVDLGRFDLDNLESLSIAGSESGALASAREYSSASSILLRSRRPQLNGKKHALRGRLSAGSFDTYQYSLTVDERLRESDWLCSVNYSWAKSSGAYPFTYRKTDGYDTTALRTNSDVRMLRGEANIFSPSGFNAKLQLYTSERGYPGAFVREESGAFSHHDRQWDDDISLQGSYTGHEGRFSYSLRGKALFSYLRYLSDPRLDETTMYAYNTFAKSEASTSFSASYKADFWEVHSALDWEGAHLGSNVGAMDGVRRNSLFWVAGMSAKVKSVSIKAAAAGSAVTENRQNEWKALTPQGELWWAWDDLSGIGAYFKQTYRVPSFNDLYYTFIGNPDLKAEKASQTGMRLRLEKAGREFSAEAYNNRISNKIVALPSSNQFRWTMMNFGEVLVRGLEINSSLPLYISALTLRPRLAATLQKAIDVSSADSPWYGGRIPYSPLFSASAILSAEWKGWKMDYSFIYTSSRYDSAANIAVNYLPPWYTSDLAIHRNFTFLRLPFDAELRFSNLFDQQYELVRSYPMPGINCTFTLCVNI